MLGINFIAATIIALKVIMVPKNHLRSLDSSCALLLSIFSDIFSLRDSICPFTPSILFSSSTFTLSILFSSRVSTPSSCALVARVEISWSLLSAIAFITASS